MENQPTTNLSDISSANPTVINQPPIPQQTKTNLMMPVLVTLLVSAVLFGFGGYYLGKQNSMQITQQYVDQKLLASPTPVTTSAPDAQVLNLKTYSSSNQSYVPSVFLNEFPNFKNDIPSKFTLTYPNTWEIFKIDSSSYNKTVLMFSLHKNDPEFSNCKSEGPCENFADMQFRIGMTDSTIKDFDNQFWGQGYPIAKTMNKSINGVDVVQVFNTATSPFPMGSLYKISPTAQMNITSEFFNYNDESNTTEYSKQTIQEIIDILLSIKFQ
jgi:hypothetical protein